MSVTKFQKIGLYSLLFFLFFIVKVISMKLEEMYSNSKRLRGGFAG